jgi:biotin carboxyl carrier protein
MIVRVQKDDKEYQVEIIDLNARPVVAVIDGEKFEVWPERANTRQSSKSLDVKIEKPKINNGYANNLTLPNPSQSSLPTTAFTKPADPLPASGSRARPADGAVRSPLPGIIISVAVKPGDRVHSGQQLCVLEAMKMNNSILASREGTITIVNIHPGQPVRARDILIEVTDL